MKNRAELRHIVVVGGGTAGWMSALILADTFAEALAAGRIGITVLESPTVGVIGVGEGSTAALKRFFDSLGIEEAEWMPECHATFKNGITFDGWSTRPGFGSYFHQFSSMVDKLTQPVFVANAQARLRGVDAPALPDDYFLSHTLVRRKLAPHAAESFPFTVTYGYHFDAVLLGRFLHRKALERGVRHRLCHVAHASCHADGDVAAVHLDDGSAVHADVFVDCSGFAALLIDKTLHTPFHSYARVLHNDAAVALPTPLDGPVTPHTVSTAMRCGWAWKIPLTSRHGNGYVYSTSHCSADQAEHELRARLGLLDADVAARHLKMKIGRVEQHWRANVVAVGLSQGFLEPLEATALYLTQTTIALFAIFLDNGDYGPTARKAYNDEINGFFDGHRDYIVAHFKTNTRTDTAYWRDNAGGLDLISDSLKRIFETWLQAGDLGAEITRQDLERYYPIGSWYALLAGMGMFPTPSPLGAPEAQGYARQRAEMGEFLRRCALNFRDQGEVLAGFRAAHALGAAA